MYRILIVDDERIERSGIKMLLKQMQLSCEIAEASNGQEALEYLQSHEADILLTDVKMPFMDGIRLIEESQKLGKEMRCVIFSGCSEFDYARKAVRLGVSNYILKPVDPREFRETITEVVSQLEAARAERRLRAQNVENMREHALYQIVNGASVEEVLAHCGGLVKKEDLDCYCRILLLESSHDFFGREGVDLEQRILKEGDGHYLNLTPQQSLLLMKNPQTDCVRFAEELLARIEEVYGERCFLAVSSPLSGARQMAGAMEELELLMENRFYHPDCSLFYNGMEKNDSELIQIDDDTLIKQMKQDIRMKDIPGLREHFARFSQKYRSRTAFSQMYIKFLFANLLKDIYDSLPGGGADRLNREIDILYRAVDLSQVTMLVQAAIDRLEKSLAAKPVTSHREVEAAKQYIYDHYGEEISVERLGELVYMTPSYLSSVFKKETGQNLSRFIKSVRMERAKEMLSKTMMKIVDISTACGYPNVSYFCSSFREYYGVSPQKFRESGEESIEEQ